MDLKDFIEFQKNEIEQSELTRELLIFRSVLGLNGEAGEVAEWVKKDLFKKKDMAFEDLKSELGDVFGYLAQTCAVFGIDLEEVAEMNRNKIVEKGSYR